MNHGVRDPDEYRDSIVCGDMPDDHPLLNYTTKLVCSSCFVDGEEEVLEVTISPGTRCQICGEPIDPLNDERDAREGTYHWVLRPYQLRQV